jgi:hypothetical protein
MVVVFRIDPDNIASAITVPVDQVDVSSVQVLSDECPGFPDVVLDRTPERFVSYDGLETNVGIQSHVAGGERLDIVHSVIRLTLHVAVFITIRYPRPSARKFRFTKG